MKGINWGSILAKADKCMKTPDKKKEIQKVVDSKMSNKEINKIKAAANRFVEILKRCIDDCSGINFANGSLGNTAISALKNIEVGEVSKSHGNNVYSIPINFVGSRSRKSLDPDKYTQGIEDIVALLNNGYSADGSAFGVWQGHTDKPIHSFRDRKGAYFIENAIHQFMSNEASVYGVIDIKVNMKWL